MLIRKEIADNMGILALQGHAVIPGLCFQDTLALRYNDIAPLENHHASASVMLGRTGSCFFQEVIALSSRIMGPSVRPPLLHIAAVCAKLLSDSTQLMTVLCLWAGKSLLLSGSKCTRCTSLPCSPWG